MIVADRKEITEIAEMVKPYEKILICACESCVTVCQAGGRKEAEALKGLLVSEAAEKGLSREIEVASLERQCEPEYASELAEQVDAADVVLSTACGVGVQTMARTYESTVILPALNTTFYGEQVEDGVWGEVCAGCGNCVLAKTGGICPVARCSKSLLNGPCGGSAEGTCEVDPDNIECAWQLIFDRLVLQGRLANIEEVEEIRDWSTSRSGGVRQRIYREGLIEDQ
jgi:hypothetical protein